MEHPEVPVPLREMLAKAQEPQRGFGWNPESWKIALHDCPDVLDHLEQLPEEIDCGEVCKVVTAALREGYVLSAFVTAMIWGYGTAGYGPAVRTIFEVLKLGPSGVIETLSLTVGTRKSSRHTLFPLVAAAVAREDLNEGLRRLEPEQVLKRLNALVSKNAFALQSITDNRGVST